MVVTCSSGKTYEEGVLLMHSPKPSPKCRALRGKLILARQEGLSKWEASEGEWDWNNALRKREDKAELQQKASCNLQWPPVHLSIFSCKHPPPQTRKSIIVPPPIIQLLDHKSVGLWQAAAPVICLYWSCTDLLVQILWSACTGGSYSLTLWQKAMAESGPKATTIPVFLPPPAVLFPDPPSYEDKAPVCQPQLCAEPHFSMDGARHQLCSGDRGGKGSSSVTPGHTEQA